MRKMQNELIVWASRKKKQMINVVEPKIFFSFSPGQQISSLCVTFERLGSLKTQVKYIQRNLTAQFYYQQFRSKPVQGKFFTLR